MSDEMIQQQRTPSAVPYVGVGAALGAGGGYLLGAKKPGWALEPAKYESWDKIVEEMSDKDAFVSTVKEVDESLADKAGELAEKAAQAGTNYDTAYTAYENGLSKADGIGKKLNEAKSAYNAKLDTEVQNVINEAKNSVNNNKTLSAEAKEAALKAIENSTTLGKEAKNAAKEALNGDMSKLTNKARTIINKAFDNAAFKEGGAKRIAEGRITAEKNALDEAKNAVKAEFEKTNGTRAAKVKEAVKNGEKDLSRLLEKGKVKGGKLAWVMGGVALGGALLGYLFAPKNNKA